MIATSAGSGGVRAAGHRAAARAACSAGAERRQPLRRLVRRRSAARSPPAPAGRADGLAPRWPPRPVPEPGQRGHAERGRVRDAAHLDRQLQQVGLGLHQQPGPGQPAVGPQRGQRAAEVGGDRAGQQRDRRREPVDRRRGSGAPGWCPGRARGTPRGRPGASAARRARPARAGTPRRRCRAPSRPASSSSAASREQADLAQPPDRGAGRVDLPVQAVGRRPGQPPGYRRGQSAGRAHGRWPRWWPAGTRRSRRCTWPGPRRSSARPAAPPAGRRRARPPAARAPNAVVSPGDRRRSRRPAAARRGPGRRSAHASADQSAASRSSSSVRDAVAASVT